MIHDGIDYTPNAVPRRFDPSKAATATSNADTLSRIFAQSNTIDISKFIALLDDEGVTVSGGEPTLDIDCPARNWRRSSRLLDSGRHWHYRRSGLQQVLHL